MPSTNSHGSKPERVALYLRVSSEEQRDRETIELQRDFLEQYCNLHELEVTDVYEDNGVSGTIPVYERPEGRRLLEDAKGGGFGALLVYRLDRLGRSLLVIVDAHNRLEEAGVAMRSGTEPIDTSNPSGRFIFQMLASFADFERESIRERTQAGLHRALRNGKQLGMIPYGYDISPDGSFVIIEDEARIVAEIIANIAAGATLYSEAERLNDEGVPSPGSKNRGKPRKYGSMWRVPTVQGIVKRGAYSGTHTVNAHKEPIERKVPAIVEPGLQQKALARMAENRRFSALAASRTGSISCGALCGANGAARSTREGLRPRTGTATITTVPREIESPVKSVSRPTTRACACERSGLKSWYGVTVRSFLKNPGEVLERVRVELAEDAESEDLEERHASLVRRLAAKQTEKGRYVKLYAQGHLDEEELEVHLVDLKNQVENLKLLIASVGADIGRKEENKLTAQTTEAWLMTLRERIEEVEEDTGKALEKRRELMKLLVEQIKVDRNEDGHTQIQITYRFGPPPEEPENVYGIQHSVL